MDAEGQRRTRDIGQADVEHHQVGDGASCEELEGVSWVSGIQTIEACILQVPAGDPPDRRFILHDQNEWGHSRKSAAQ